MFKSFNVMKDENAFISGRKLGDRVIKSDLIDYRHFERILRSGHYLNRSFTFFSRLLELDRSLPEVHEHLVDGQSVKLRGEC